ncbi:hypothetical protein Tco_0971167 [Tanacetum coccineum]
MSAMSVNDLYQPWRAILSMINMCLTGKFVQSIQTFPTDKKRLTMTLRRKKKSAPLLMLSIRFTKQIIHHLNTKHNIYPRTGLPLHYSHDDNVLGNLRFVGKDGREVFGMLIPDALFTDAIKRAPYYGGYLTHVTEYQQHLDGEHGMVEEGVLPESPILKETKETPDEPSPAKRSKAGLVGKRRKTKSPLKLVDEFADEGVPMSEPKIVDKEADYQRDVELSLKDLEAKTQGPARTVVLRVPDSGRFQPLPEVQGKGKEKFIEEQAARDLLTLQTLKNETESDEEVTPVNKEKDASNIELTEINVFKMKARLDQTMVNKMKARLDQTLENLKLSTEDQVILEEPTSSTRTLSSLQHLEKELSFID